MLPDLVRRIGHDGPSKHPIVYPHQYDRIHDSFGPGVFLSWLILAYGIAAHSWGPQDHRLFMILLDKDLVFTLAYPMITSFYLLSKFAQYPGPKEKLWNWETPDENFAQYAAAIWAPAQVCLYALGANFVLLFFLKCWKRALLVLGANIWIFIVLIVVNSHDGQHFILVLGGIFGTAIVFVASGAGACGVTLILAIAAVRIYVVTNWLLQGRFLKFIGGLFGLFGNALLVGICILFPIVGLLYVYGYWLAFPRTDHSFLDFGQLSALGFGCINLVFTLCGLWKENGIAFLAHVLARADYEGEIPVVPPKYQQLQNEAVAEVDVEMGDVPREQDRNQQLSRRVSSASEVSQLPSYTRLVNSELED